MNIIIFGATVATGRLVVEAALDAGHIVLHSYASRSACPWRKQPYELSKGM